VKEYPLVQDLWSDLQTRQQQRNNNDDDGKSQEGLTVYVDGWRYNDLIVFKGRIDPLIEFIEGTDITWGRDSIIWCC